MRVDNVKNNSWIDCYVSSWQKFANFSGKSSIKEFLIFNLFNFVILAFIWSSFIGVIISSLPSIFDFIADIPSLNYHEPYHFFDRGLSFYLGRLWQFIFGHFSSFTILLYLFFIGILFKLAIIIPTISLSVRRLHDTGRSGLFLLFFFLPVFGLLIVLVLLLMPAEEINNY